MQDKVAVTAAEHEHVAERDHIAKHEHVFLFSSAPRNARACSRAGYHESHDGKCHERECHYSSFFFE